MIRKYKSNPCSNCGKLETYAIKLCKYCYGKAWESKNKDRVVVYRKRNRSSYPEKHAARRIFYEAIRVGKIIRSTICSRAIFSDLSCRGRIEAHHYDYDKPLDVEWLCFAHHNQVHTAPVIATKFNRSLVTKKEKRCSKCKIIKSVDLFSGDIGESAFMKSACKSCNNEYNRRKYQEKTYGLKENNEFS